MADPNEEEITMTPSKKGKATVIKIERKRKIEVEDKQAAYVGGGEHRGLVINKEAESDEPDARPQLQLGFTCFLVDQKSGKHASKGGEQEVYISSLLIAPVTVVWKSLNIREFYMKKETRKLKFWFRDGTAYLEQVTTAYEFFKELMKPENFPKDYVGFIKKCMKQMQSTIYNLAVKVDLEIEQHTQDDTPLNPGLAKEDTRPQEEIVREKLLLILESAYPNVLVVEDLVRITAADEALITEQLQELRHKELISEMESGGFVRRVLDVKTEVQMVKQMPTIESNQQPTIAIITAMYYEKVAVDAMMENKTTFVRFKNEGESNVYTVGYIGEHKCVSTKLPAVGHARRAQIIAGNTTTRLLGTFQNIEHVFVVGVAGGVPHYTDYYKHVRSGDVVISRGNAQGNVYNYCTKILKDKEGDIHYKMKVWAPRDFQLQKIAEKIVDAHRQNPDYAPWEEYIREGQEYLRSQEVNFFRPPVTSDRLYMSIGDDNVIEVQHPEPPPGAENLHTLELPKIHFGPFGAGRLVTKTDATRLDFSSRYEITAFDTEFDQVLESVEGNRKDSFLIIRGISDYVDGSKSAEWQPYSSLAAAAMMKTIIKSLANRALEDD